MEAALKVPHSSMLRGSGETVEIGSGTRLEQFMPEHGV
jgi:hypothetical protein